jgi:hypothetical protein
MNDDDGVGVGVCAVGRVANNYIEGSADDDDVRIGIVFSAV